MTVISELEKSIVTCNELKKSFVIEKKNITRYLLQVTRVKK